MPTGSDDSRQRGILTEADRKYLRDPEAYAETVSRQSLIERRDAIRERVWNALLDFELLASIPPELRHTVLHSDDPYAEKDKPASHHELEIGLAWMIAFAHQLATDLGTGVELIPPDDSYKSVDFEIQLQEGLERAYIEENLVVKDLTLQIDAQKVPGLSEVRDRLEDGQSPSPQTVQYLIETDKIHLDEYLEFLANQLDATLQWKGHSSPQGDDEVADRD